MQSVPPVQPLPTPPAIEVLSRVVGERLEVVVRGELDVATHDELATLLGLLDLTSHAGHVDVVLDELAFADSHGTRQLLAFAQAARDAGADVALHGVGAQVSRMVALVSPAA